MVERADGHRRTLLGEFLPFPHAVRSVPSAAFGRAEGAARDGVEEGTLDAEVTEPGGPFLPNGYRTTRDLPTPLRGPAFQPSCSPGKPSSGMMAPVHSREPREGAEMTEQASSAMLTRLRGVEWNGDWDQAFGHIGSRRVLMREYLRRAARWARVCSAESAWPFFDVTEYVDPAFRLSPEIARQLQEYLSHVPRADLADTCAGAVRMAELRDRNPAVLPDLPDLYEPLVRFYERGGEFIRDNGGFLDLTGVSFRPGTLQSHLGVPTLRTLGERTLDAMDAAGRISYYAPPGGKGPLVRRRERRGTRDDEVLRQDARWEATDSLPASEEGLKDNGWVRLDEMRAAEAIEVAVAHADKDRELPG